MKSPDNRELKELINKCWMTHDGMKSIGLPDRYECGIFHRVEAWFDFPGVKYKVTPQVTGCMALTDGACFRDYVFDFGSG